MLTAALVIQEHESEVVQGVIRVRKAAADTLFDAGRVVHERDATLQQRLSGDDSETFKAVEVHAARAYPLISTYLIQTHTDWIYRTAA